MIENTKITPNGEFVYYNDIIFISFFNDFFDARIYLSNDYLEFGVYHAYNERWNNTRTSKD